MTARAVVPDVLDKDAFLKPGVPKEMLMLPGVGEIRVRGLTRSEAVSLQKVKDDPAALEQLIVRLGLVEPALTAPEVQTWYETAPAGLTDLIVSAVERLSGLKKDAA